MKMNLNKTEDCYERNVHESKMSILFKEFIT